MPQKAKYLMIASMDIDPDHEALFTQPVRCQKRPAIARAREREPAT